MVALSSIGGAGWQFFDNNGDPLSGGKLYVYAAGTTTPVTTYTDDTGTVPNTNPVILDSAGRVPNQIWLTSGATYKFVLATSTNVILWTKDDVPGILNSVVFDATNVIYDPPFLGAVTSNYSVENKLQQYVSVKDFGAIGNGVIDDTAAIQSAINYLGSINPWPVNSSRGRLRPALYFPAGVYKVSSSININFSSLDVYGDGPESSLIAWYGFNSPVFEIGTFSSSPTDLFTGPQDISFENLRIQHAAPGLLGSRNAQGIRSSGGGGLRLNRVAVLGFAYGINCPYGGDFNNYSETVAEYCDVGIYQGPGGQQFYTSKINCFACVEGMVLDRVVSNMHDTFIGNNCKTAAIVIEAVGLTSTRQLASFPPAGTSFQSQIVFNSPWFEGNAGGMGDDFTPTNFIEQRNNTVQAYRNITIKDPIVVAGRTGTKTSTSVFANTGTGPAAQLVRIFNLVFAGYMTRFLTNPNGTIIDNYRVEQGYTTPAFADNSGYQIFEDGLRAQTYRSAITGNQQYFVNADSTFGIRITYNNDNVVYAFSNAGVWIDRFGFSVQNRRLFLGDPANNEFSVSSSAALPTTGTFAIGSFVYNTAPTVVAGKTLLGWQRLTTGSGHVLGTDWSPCYVTNS